MNCENLGCTHNTNNDNWCIILYLRYFAGIAFTSNLKNNHYYLEINLSNIVLFFLQSSSYSWKIQTRCAPHKLFRTAGCGMFWVTGPHASWLAVLSAGVKPLCLFRDQKQLPFRNRPLCLCEVSLHFWDSVKSSYISTKVLVSFSINHSGSCALDPAKYFSFDAAGSTSSVCTSQASSVFLVEEAIIVSVSSSVLLRLVSPYKYTSLL